CERFSPSDFQLPSKNSSQRGQSPPQSMVYSRSPRTPSEQLSPPVPSWQEMLSKYNNEHRVIIRYMFDMFNMKKCANIGKTNRSLGIVFLAAEVKMRRCSGRSMRAVGSA